MHNMFFGAPPSRSGFAFTPEPMHPAVGIGPTSGMGSWAMQGLQAPGLGNTAPPPGMQVRGGYGLNLEQPQQTQGQLRPRRASYQPIRDGLMQAAPRNPFQI